MAGFWEALVATHLYNTTTHVLKTVNEFLTSVTGSSYVFFNETQSSGTYLLANESHLLNTAGPTSAGWAGSGGGRVKSFNLLGVPFNLPANVKAVIVRLNVAVNNDAGQAGFNRNTIQAQVYNAANALDTNAWQVVGQSLSNGANNVDREQSEILAIVPVDSTNQTITLFCAWPNIAVTLGATTFTAQLYGYITG